MSTDNIKNYPLVETIINDDRLKFYSQRNKFAPQSISISNFKDRLRGYKIFSALATQTGTNPPVLTILENTIGDINSSYDGDGSYSITSNGLFTEGKTAIIGSNSIQSANGVTVWLNSDDSTILIATSVESVGTLALTNNQLYNAFFEIRVYF